MPSEKQKSTAGTAGGWTNIQNYLNANPTAGSEIASNIQTKANEKLSGMQDALKESTADIPKAQEAVGFNKDMFGNNPPAEFTVAPVCDELEVGQEFISDDDVSCPPGFCAWAFADIQRDISHLCFDGDYDWMKEKGVVLSCCTDGIRPVIFKLERIED